MATLLLPPALRAQETGETPSPVGPDNIRSIVTNGNTLKITVAIPAGTNQVSLQSRPKSSDGGWKPIAVRRVTGRARNIVFDVTKSKTQESFQAVIGPVPLPAKFYKGRSTFPAAKGSSGNVAAMGGTLAAPVSFASTTDPTASTTTGDSSVAESDIWSISGNRLYFFNQYRGLEVFDVSQPDSAAPLGTLSLAGSGEQMYLLDTNHVLLLTQDCSGDGESQLALVDVSTGVPTLMTNLSLAGYVDDSRQVGTSVYVAYSTVIDTNGDYGTEVSSFDFSNPATPVARATLDLPGWNNFLTASGNFLLAVSADPTNYSQSDVACIDISAGNGAMALQSSIQAAGQIQDQFALSLSNNILTVVSESWDDAPDPEFFTEEMWLENFSLANPAAPARVASLDLGAGDLGATRFDTNRVYITSGYGGPALTIVNLTDPANPVVVGLVNDPSAGQSFIFPLGNQLVAIGPDTNGNTSLSLFDVTDPAGSSLLSEIVLGTDYSWSEAEYDVQAFTLLPAIGLIMIPYQTYNSSGSSSSGIQLIDLNTRSLALRGVIPEAQARRATFLNNRVVSISGTDLISADISDQDQPIITGDLVLSWPVDQVFLSGGYLVELSTGVSEQAQPVLTVAASATPNVALARWTFTNSAVLGATMQGSLLYLLQGPAPSGLVFDPPVGAGGASDETNGTTLTLSIVELTNLPAMSLLGQTNFTISQSPGAGAQAVWPQPGTLVWVANASHEWFWPVAGSVARPLARSTAPKIDKRKLAHREPKAAAKSEVITEPLLPWFYNGGGIQMYAFDVSTPASPTFSSIITVGTNGWPDGNAAFATNGLVYVDHSVWDHGGQDFTERNNLDVVDFTVPSSPVARNAVEIPGALTGVSRDGNVIYTVDFNGALAALAYDGISAYLIDELQASTNGFQATLVVGETVFVAQPTSADETESQLAGWTLANTGQFSLEGALTLPQPVYAMANFGSLLGIQAGAGVNLVNIIDPANLASIGTGVSNDCLWLSLTGADGGLGSGLWLPLGAYGVFPVPASQ